MKMSKNNFYVRWCIFKRSKRIEIATDSISSHAIINLLIRWPTIVPVRFRQEAFLKYHYLSQKSNLLSEYTVWYRVNQDYTMTLNELEKGDKKGLLVQLWSFIRWLTVNYHKPPGQLARLRFLNGPDSN